MKITLFQSGWKQKKIITNGDDDVDNLLMYVNALIWTAAILIVTLPPEGVSLAQAIFILDVKYGLNAVKAITFYIDEIVA